jgi:hypothetical protein
VEVAKALWRGDYTYLEDPLVNGNSEAVVSVTQNWNPGGLEYDDTERDRWLVYNTDLAPIKEGAAANMGIS